MLMNSSATNSFAYVIICCSNSVGRPDAYFCQWHAACSFGKSIPNQTRRWFGARFGLRPEWILPREDIGSHNHQERELSTSEWSPNVRVSNRHISELQQCSRQMVAMMRKLMSYHVSFLDFHPLTRFLYNLAGLIFICRVMLRNYDTLLAHGSVFTSDLAVPSALVSARFKT